MPTVDEVIVQLEARVGDYNRKIAQADRNFDKSMGNIRGAAGRTEKLVSVSFRAMAAAAGAIGLVALGKQAVQTALDFRRVETAMATATGSAEAAGVQFDFLRDLAERLGLRFITLADTYTGFAAAARGTNIEGRQTQEIFEAITTAVVATGGSMEQAEGALRAVEQMVSKGNVSAEELRGQLGERLPGAFQIAARAMGVTTQELGKMLEQGELVADEFLPRFAAQLRSELPTSVETADAAFQRFHTVLDDIANSTAGGFMAELGEATDDLTQILKDLQASGALEQFGAFLGDIIRLGGGAIETMINLAASIRQAGREARIRVEESLATGFATKNTPRGRQAAAFVAGVKGEAAGDVIQAILGASSAAATPSAGRTVLAPFTGAGGGGKKTKGKTADQLARDAERAAEEAKRNLEAFNRELFQAQQDGLRAQQDLADSGIDRAAIERELLTRATAQAEKEIQADDRYSQAQKDALITILKRNEYLEADLINKEEGQRLTREAADLEDARLRLGIDLLGIDGDLARTAKERRDIELKILDLAFRRERAQLEALIADETATQAARQAAQERLGALPRLQAGAEEGVRRRNMSPLESYLDSLPRSAAEANEAMEAVAAGGIQSIVDGLADAVTGARSLADVFKNVAKQIIADLIRIQLQKAVVGALSGIFGGGLSDVANPNSGFSQMVNALPGRASGGHVSAGRLYRVNEGGGIEGFQPAGSGKIIPLGQMKRAVNGGGTTVVQPLQFDLRGAVMTEQILAQMNAMAERAAAQGAMGGAALARRNSIKAARRSYLR